MHDSVIKKTLKKDEVPPNLQDYLSFYSSFSWENVAKELDGLPDKKGINIAYEAVDRHIIAW